MNHYNVYIDKIYWGSFHDERPIKDYRGHMQEQLKHLHPLNMSDEGAIEYRKRYKDSTVYVYKSGEKAIHINKK